VITACEITPERQAVPRPKPQIDLATQARHKVVMEACESRSQILLITSIIALTADLS
jgi:hypothetical protein